MLCEPRSGGIRGWPKPRLAVVRPAATHLPAKLRIPAITALRHRCGPVTGRGLNTHHHSADRNLYGMPAGKLRADG
jgi:hypothetical protein